jgi:hypothetical protein
MSTVYLFGDEAGNFDFSDGPGASRYFILATVTMSNCQAGDRLQALRRRLAWQGVHLGAVLHAIPAAMRNPQDLYRHVWHEHFARIAQDIAQPGDRLLAVASDLGTRKRRGAFHVAVDDAVRASARCTHRVAFWPNMSEPCLVVADYCTWAIQRKWERDDTRSQVLLHDKIASETEIEVAGNK